MSKSVIVNVVGPIPTGGNLIFYWNILNPFRVNPGLKCKFDIIVKNSNVSTLQIVAML